MLATPPTKRNTTLYGNKLAKAGKKNEWKVGHLVVAFKLKARRFQRDLHSAHAK